MVIVLDRALEFGEVVREPEIRHARDMEEVIIDKEWLNENEDAELYFMYRGLWHAGDEEKIRENKLRYDITIIPSREMGKEYVKTKGHYHPEAAPGISYPEIYEVLEGEAHYLLQKKNKGKLEDVILIKGKPGEKALIPPSYGHITINPSDEDLKMANWVDRSFDSIYEDILELKGGAYYELVGGQFIENPNYERVPELMQAEPTEIPNLGIESGTDMYELIEKPENLEFLTKPQEHEAVFEDVL